MAADTKQWSCSTCALSEDAHAERCTCCRGPLCHHPGRRTPDLELIGRARMAAARQAAGLELDATDRRALSRWPDPTMADAAALAS